MLYHTGQRERRLYVTPMGGLGNRLMAIFGTIACCFIEKYDQLVIRWAKNGHCPLSLHEIIKIVNVDHQVLETPKYVHKLPELVLKPFQFFGDGCIYESTMSSSSPSPLTIMQWIIDNIAKYVEFIPYQPIAATKLGLHCRRSDWGATSVNNYDMTDNLREKRQILDVEFEKFINPIITGHSTFLSTDSIRTEDYIKSRHPHVIITKKTRYPIRTSRDAVLMREALVDLHTLAESQTIIRDSESTFSFVATLMNGGFTRPNRLITWPRPVLQGAGPGF